jgi:hypothetical protein
MKGFSSQHYSVSNTETNCPKKKGGKLLLPPITPGVNTARGRQLLENIRYSDVTFSSEQELSKNNEKKRKSKKAKRKKRAKQEKKFKLEGWEYESDFETDSESSNKATDGKAPRKTKRRHKKKQKDAHDAENSDEEYKHGRSRRNDGSVSTERLPDAADEPDMRIQSWLCNPPPGEPSSADDTVEKKRERKYHVISRRDKQTEETVRNISRTSSVATPTKIQYNCNPGSKMAPWAWKTDETSKLIEDDDDLFLRNM